MKSYFKIKEFFVNDSIDNIIHEERIKVFDNLFQLFYSLNVFRTILNVPIYINSGFRSTEHNASVGGSATSQHLDGGAVDITTRDYRLNNKLYQLICAQVINGETDFGQIIDYRTKNKDIEFIHISVPTHKHLNEFLTLTV